MSTLSLSGVLLALVALFAGVVVPIQAASNALLARQLGHPLWATAISLIISIIVLIPLLFMFKVSRPNFSIELFQQPIWIWFGGLAGMLYLTSALILVPRIGSTTFFVMVIVGQLMISALIEHFGWFGMPQNPVPLGKILGIGLVITGVFCVQLSRK
ncbi:DMT family transporter [Providencia rettgeri]|uniref:DMT family transporter n=1 Tax=Providencia rettgeri TaxID=587 RepID=UPI002360DE59|nr:DMT family transporter [Providencia rettgeri]EMB5784552.1 DMT family transporter [Providencia rettgeri]